jgi:hypothetical protein
MCEDIVSEEGLDTTHAVIRAAPSRNGAIVSCRLNFNYTQKCIEDQILDNPHGILTANCPKGQFSDFYGNRYKFIGKNPNTDGNMSANYLIKNESVGEILDGSGASGYGIAAGIFESQCPALAPQNW